MKKVLLVVCAILPLAATMASAEVSLTEQQHLRNALGVPANVSLEHALRNTGPKSDGSLRLIDESGLQFFINSDITFSTTSNGEGADSEASYTHAVAADTLNGGTTSSTLNDMFDGYNTLHVNNTNDFDTGAYGSTNFTGPATLVASEHTVITAPVSKGDLLIYRKIFVPTNDTFCRWLNIIKNTGSVAQVVNVSIQNNLGSDSKTKIDMTSSGDTTVDVNDTWVASFQDWSGTTSSDVRQGAILRGIGARIGFSDIHFVDGDDEPFWNYQFTLQPGQEGIIMNFVTGQPTRQAVRTKAASIVLLRGHELDFMTGTERAEVLNFNAAANTPNDFVGVGKSAPGVYDPLRSTFFLLDPITGFEQVKLTGGSLQPVEGDFDGDGKADIAGYNNLNGNWVIQNSGALPKRESLISTQQFGYFGAVPVPADYDGDGRTDLAVYDPNGGNWFLMQSTAGFSTAQFGSSGSVPVPGDYDGDGKADLAVFDSKSGTWSINESTAGFVSQQFGFAGVKPIPADYDGDGKTDIAVYDPIRAIWYIQGSTAGFSQVQFGSQGMVPVLGDYDGDGRTDLTVYSRLQGQWYRLRSTAGFDTFQFGYFAAQPLGGK